jgi:hypothetical protein
LLGSSKWGTQRGGTSHGGRQSRWVAALARGRRGRAGLYWGRWAEQHQWADRLSGQITDGRERKEQIVMGWAVKDFWAQCKGKRIGLHEIFFEFENKD